MENEDYLMHVYAIILLKIMSLQVNKSICKKLFL